MGAEVSILPLELAETACAEAGVKWNPPRQKRAGQRGKIAEVTEGGAKASGSTPAELARAAHRARADVAEEAAEREVLEVEVCTGHGPAAQLAATLELHGTEVAAGSDERPHAAVGYTRASGEVDESQRGAEIADEAEARVGDAAPSEVQCAQRRAAWEQRLKQADVAGRDQMRRGE